MLLMSFAAMSCDRPNVGQQDLPEPAAEQPAAPGASRTAVFAGGCFWCVEAVFEQLDGVSDVVSGYAGGNAGNADYNAVSAGATNHAEVVQITYDPQRITYGKLLKVFFATHDPTQLNAQGPDHGRQYRSAIFYADEPQRQSAEAYIQQLNEADVYDKPIVTTLEPLEAFYPAEKYHQDFVQNNPQHGYVRMWALPKIDKVREKFSDQLK